MEKAATPEHAGLRPLEVFGHEATETGCTARGFEDHDYSQPPHNTPETPSDAIDGDDVPCHAQSADGPPWCQHEARYEVVVYQIGTHEWIRLRACVPCTAALRKRHARLGPDGTQGIARVRELTS